MARRLISNDQVLAGMLQDPAFRAEWERTALARAVAEAVIRYRAEHKLTQTGLARLLGWSQPVVGAAGSGRAQPHHGHPGRAVTHAGPAGARGRRPEDRRGRQSHQVPRRLTQPRRADCRTRQAHRLPGKG